MKGTYTKLIKEEKALVYTILKNVEPFLQVAYKNDKQFIYILHTIQNKLKIESEDLLQEGDK